MSSAPLIDPHPDGTPRRGDLLLWFAVFAVAGAFYFATSYRGVGWTDAGHQQYRISIGQLAHEGGLTLVHPLQYWLGRAAIWLTPFEPAFAVTLVSVFAGALTLANLVIAMRWLTGMMAAAWLATLALAFSHTFWQHSTHTECYTLVTAAMTAEWLALAGFLRTGRPRWLVLALLFNGLGVANHLLSGLVTPVLVALVIYAWRRNAIPTRGLIWAAAAWLVGALPYTGLVLLELLATGDLVATLTSATTGKFHEAVFNVQVGTQELLLPVGYIIYNFPNVALILALIGFAKWRAVPRWLAVFFLVEIAIYLIFAWRYRVPDQYVFFMPVYALIALAAGRGYAVLARTHPQRRRWLLPAVVVTIVLNPLTYLAAANVAREQGWFADLVQAKPYREGYRTWFVPWGVGNEYSDELKAAIRDLAGPDGLVVIRDPMIFFGLKYAEENDYFPPGIVLKEWPEDEDRREADVRLDAVIDAFEAGRPVVLVPRDRNDPASGLSGTTWRRMGDLYVLESIKAPPHE